MKKLLFSAYNLDIGGIETALVTLLNTLVKEGYSITLSLEEKKGIFLNTIDKRITVVENCPSSNKNIIVRKTINFIQKIKLFKTYKNKFDFSASFATYSNMGSFLARISSKNSYLWGHADYLTLFNNNKKLMKKFFSQKKINKFRKIVFVSNEGKESFVKVFPKMKDKTIVLNNIINAKKILNLSSEKIDIDKLNIPTFVNIGRHDERQKKLSRIIEAAKILKDKKYKFRVILVGDGNDTSYYQNTN